MHPPPVPCATGWRGMARASTVVICSRFRISSFETSKYLHPPFSSPCPFFFFASLIKRTGDEERKNKKEREAHLSSCRWHLCPRCKPARAPLVSAPTKHGEHRPRSNSQRVRLPLSHCTPPTTNPLVCPGQFECSEG